MRSPRIPRTLARVSLSGLVVLAAAATTFGCGSGGAEVRTPPPPPPATSAPEPQPEPVVYGARPRELTAVVDPRLQEPFEPGRVAGTVAVYDTGDGVLRCGDLERCARGHVPASTFKITNTLIALENGVIGSAEAPLAWDGQLHAVEDWNRDHTVRSAFRASCVPCFQQIAREIGESRMRDWLARLEYGNQDCSGSVDFFWLGGPLLITPLEQLDFLWRLDAGELSLRPETLAVVRDVMEIEGRDGTVLRGKTGWAAPPEVEQEVAWFVGWVEVERRRVFFATIIDERAPELDLAAARREVTEQALRALGLDV